MDKFERSTYRPIPEGHYRVGSGPILPDDLCLSVMTGEWIRFDDPNWLNPAKNAEDAFMVARKARFEPAPGQQTHKYTLTRSADAEKPPEIPTAHDDEPMLF